MSSCLPVFLSSCFPVFFSLKDCIIIIIIQLTFSLDYLKWNLLFQGQGARMLVEVDKKSFDNFNLLFFFMWQLKGFIDQHEHDKQICFCISWSHIIFGNLVLCPLLPE
jgi:hypothetical protein